MSSGKKSRFLSEETSFRGVARFDSAEETQNTTKSSNRNTKTLSSSRAGCRDTRNDDDDGGCWCAAPEAGAIPEVDGWEDGSGVISALGDKSTSGPTYFAPVVDASPPLSRASRALFVARTRCLKSEYILFDHLVKWEDDSADDQA